MLGVGGGRTARLTSASSSERRTSFSAVSMFWLVIFLVPASLRFSAILSGGFTERGSAAEDVHSQRASQKSTELAWQLPTSSEDGWSMGRGLLTC